MPKGYAAHECFPLVVLRDGAFWHVDFQPRGGFATCARAGIDPLFYRSSGDAAVTARGLPRFELVAINHQLHRPHRKPEHAGHFQSGVVVLNQRRWWCFFRFHELRIFLFFHSREKNLHLIQMIDMI